MVSANASNSTGERLDPVASNALILRDPPATATSTKEQDIIDLLSLTLSSSVYPETPQNSASATRNTHQEPLASNTQGNPYASQAYIGYQDQSFNSYVAPWAQPQPQPQPQPQHHLPPHYHPQYQHQGQPQFHPQFQHPTQVQFQPQPQPQSQPHHQSLSHPSTQPQPQQPQESSLQSQHTSQQHPPSPLQPELNQQPRTQLELHPQPQQLPPVAQTQFLQYSAYPPPPWAATPGYLSNPSPSSRPTYMYSTPTTNTSVPLQGPRPLQNVNTFPNMGGNGLAINGDTQVHPNPKTPTTTASGQKAFIPSYRLFEDLNVFGTGDQRHNSSSGLSGTNSQSMVGGRK